MCELCVISQVESIQALREKVFIIKTKKRKQNRRFKTRKIEVMKIISQNSIKLLVNTNIKVKCRLYYLNSVN